MSVKPKKIEKEFWDIADALSAAGITPTQKAVLEARGHGSEQTANKYLNTWKDHHSGRAATIDAELSEREKESWLEFIAQVHAGIRKRYEAEISRQKAESARKEEEYLASFEKFSEEVDALTLEKREALELLENERDSVSKLQRALADRDGRIASLVNENRILEARAGEFDTAKEAFKEAQAMWESERAARRALDAAASATLA